MDKLNFQDTAFLNMESGRHPFHIGALVILKVPDNAPANYFRQLTTTLGRLNEAWPIFNRKLDNPDDPGSAHWIVEDDYHACRHVLHYALPQPGRMDELMQLVSRIHERQLDRHRPLWEAHIIEGLPKNRFAMYWKAHHALLDGAGALALSKGLLSTDPETPIDLGKAAAVVHRESQRRSTLEALTAAGKGVLEKSRAIPEVTGLLAQMGMAALRGTDDTMKLPFTGPRTLFNTEIDSSRTVITCDLPFSRIRRIARETDSSINDVLLSICGGALRTYLREQQALPRRSLVAGLPVAVKLEEPHEGNQLSLILCPFFTNEGDALRRLRKIRRVTRSAKKQLAAISPTAAQGYSNLVLLPTMILTVTGNATKVTPAINAVFSNVPGSREKLYLEGAEVESLYPLSVITSGMGINLTVVSYATKLCFAITSCPREQPGIERLGKYLKDSYRDLAAAIFQESL